MCPLSSPWASQRKSMLLFVNMRRSPHRVLLLHRRPASNKEERQQDILYLFAFGIWPTHIDLAFSLPWKTDINGHQTSPEFPSCSIDLKVTCFFNRQTWPCKSDSQSYCTRISVQHRWPGFGCLLSGSRTQAIYHHWYSMAPWLILLLSTSHPERKLLATKTTTIHHFIAQMTTTLTSTSWLSWLSITLRMLQPAAHPTTYWLTLQRQARKG